MFYLFAAFFRVFFLVTAPDNAMKTTNAPTAELHIFFAFVLMHFLHRCEYLISFVVVRPIKANQPTNQV